jgi:hypothetical protein
MKVSVGGFLAVTTALNAALAIMVTVRKLRRDRRERVHATHRSELRRALLVGGNDLDRLLRGAARHPTRQIDLAAVLPGVIRNDGEWVIACVRVAAAKTGLAETLERRIRSRRAAVRGTAALLVGQLRLSGGAELVAPLLRDRDDDVRLVAAGALGTLANGQAASALVEALGGRTLPPERIIERIGERWATSAILARLDELGPDGSTAVRSALARALGLSGDERAEPALLAQLASPHLEVRVSAARALATCGSDRCRPHLVGLLADRAWEVRAQAAASLGALGATEAVPALADNLAHPAWWVRANAATALGRLGDEGVNALRVAAAGEDAYAAERATEVLALVGAAA